MLHTYRQTDDTCFHTFGILLGVAFFWLAWVMSCFAKDGGVWCSSFLMSDSCGREF
jgi:hypothetical protein